MSTEGYPSDWGSRRREVYKRDNYTCQNCGAKGSPHGNAKLHAHHIVPKSNGGTRQLSNLKTICSQCHDAVHGNVMAPTGLDEDSEEERVEFDDIEDFRNYLEEEPIPLAVQENKKTIFNLADLEKFVDGISAVLQDTLKTLDNMSNFHKEVPDRLLTQKRENEEAIEELLSELESLCIRFEEDSNQRVDIHSYPELHDSLSESTELLSEIYELAKQDTLYGDEASELSFLCETLAEELQQLNDVMVQLAREIPGDIDSYIKNLEEDSININTLEQNQESKSCPFCEGDLDIVYGLVLQCPKCELEWINHFPRFSGFLWKLTFGPPNIENIALTWEDWKDVSENPVKKTNGTIKFVEVDAEALKEKEETSKKDSQRIWIILGLGVVVFWIVTALTDSFPSGFAFGFMTSVLYWVYT